MALSLHNPHSVLAALQTRPVDVMEIQLPPGKPSAGWGEVAELAKVHQIPLRTALASEQRKPQPGRKEERQGVATATVRERRDVGLEELFPAESVAEHGLWLALDCLQDPHNVGAIFRSAAFFGVKGIVVTRDRSAPLTATAYDVASGGMEFVPFAQPSNLARAIELAKQAGVWVLGTSEHATKDLADIPRDRSWLVVVGNEEQGLRRLTSELCDELARLTPRGHIQSLNASVATAVTLSLLSRGR